MRQVKHLPIVSHPLDVDKALYVFIPVLVVLVICVVGTVLVFAQGGLSSTFWALMVLSCVVLLNSLIALKWLMEAIEYHEAFRAELFKARQSRLFVTGDEIRQCAEKHFISIVRREDEIKQEHAEKMERSRALSYLKAHTLEGGQEILDWWDEPMRLLRAALSVDASVSWEEQRLQRARQEVAEEETVILGETSTVIRQRQMQDDAERNQGGGNGQSTGTKEAI